MKYRRYVLTFVLAAVATGEARAVFAQASTPAVESTQSVARLQNFGTLVSFLNLASGAVRLVVVLQPSSPASDAALEAVRSMLENNASKRLRTYVVWTPLTPEDSQMRALSLANTIHDRRLVYFWDPEAFVANSFRGVVGSADIPATGVLLLYDTDAHLALSPPAPSLWMSVNPAIKGDAIDSKQLSANANTMVRRVEEKITDAAPRN
jgi:hypothetical protein